MNVAVKGSKFKPMRVIPHNPFGRMVRYGLVFLAFAVALPATYYAGVFMTRDSYESAQDVKSKQAQQAQSELNQELTLLRTNAEIDRQTMEDLRQLVMVQRAQIAAGERDLHVYKDLLSPGGKANPLGISFGVFTVLPAKEKGHFTYSLTVQKLSTKDTDFVGNLQFTILGTQGDKPLQLSLHQVSAQITAPDIPLNLKYFQTLDGELVLPPDFTPRVVELAVRSGDKKSNPIVETQLEWPNSSVQTKPIR